MVALNGSIPLKASYCGFFSVVAGVYLCYVYRALLFDCYRLKSLVARHLNQAVLFHFGVVLCSCLFWSLVNCQNRCWVNAPSLICFNIVQRHRSLWRNAKTWLVLVNHLRYNLDVALTDYYTFYFLLSAVSSCILRRPWIRSFRADLRHQTSLGMEELMCQDLAWLGPLLGIVVQH